MPDKTLPTIQFLFFFTMFFFLAVTCCCCFLPATFSATTKTSEPVEGGQNYQFCNVMVQYFARIGKPLSDETVATLDKTICQRFETMVHKRGVSAVDRKLRMQLSIRKMRRRYQWCMETHNNYLQYCHKFIINGNNPHF